jgi:hypothetical protein
MTNSVTFDTSGEVFIPDRRFPVGATRIRFSDLSPFCQGFVEAAFASLIASLQTEADGRLPKAFYPRLSDLHPATLARFMDDCEKAGGVRRFIGNGERDAATMREIGAQFWYERQRGWLRWDVPGFPKLRLYLSPDGKVMAEEVSKESVK